MSFEITLTLPSFYNWVLLSVVVICLECILTNMLVVVPARLKWMPPDFMAKFAKDHEGALGSQSMPAPGGYPDTGNGVYADKLSYEGWYRFNLAIRVYQNLVEQLPFLCGFLLIGGLYFPRFAAAIGFLNCSTRPLYIKQYLEQGSKGRRLAQIIGTGSTYTLVLLTVVEIIRQNI